MTKADYGVTIGLALLATACAFTGVANPAARATPARTSVYIEVAEGHGSGVVIGHNRVLTAAHVVKGADKVTVTFADGSKREATVLWSGAPTKEHPGHDLAMLQVDTGANAPARMSCARQEQGTPIVVYGNPLHFRAIATWGRIASYTEQQIDGLAEVAVIDATVNPGNSGGGVFNEAGELVGIVNAVALAPTYGGMMMPTSAITPLGIVTPSTVACRLLGR